jgi:S-adenosylmethionine hydrolase
VDPGVGSARRAIAFEQDGMFFVGPDNGLFSLVAPRPKRAVVLPVPKTASHTFHGRDVFAPAAGKLAAGVPLSSLGKPAGKLVQLRWPKRPEIVHVDRFGNLITNLTKLDGELAAGEFRANKLVTSYAAVRSGEPLAIIGSHGFVEIAVRNGSAAEALGLRRGDAIATGRRRGR